jgi:hypothetical protein
MCICVYIYYLSKTQQMFVLTSVYSALQYKQLHVSASVGHLQVERWSLKVDINKGGGEGRDLTLQYLGVRGLYCLTWRYYNTKGVICCCWLPRSRLASIGDNCPV